MRILVTGGAGFIGSHVAAAFQEAGHEVCVLDNLLTGSKENLPPSLNLTWADLRDPFLEQNINELDFEIICHHAAQISVPRSVEQPSADAEINISGMLNLMQIARRWKITRVIFSSSGGAVYGDPENIPVDENTPPDPLSPYAVAKLSGEAYLRYYQRAYGITFVVLRYANVYGPRQAPVGESGATAIFMKHLSERTSPTIYCPPGMPEGAVRDYIYVEDCVAANLLALHGGDNQIFNIGSGVGTATLDLWQQLVKASGVSDPPRVTMAGQRPGDVRRTVLDCGKAKRELGWEPKISLPQGLTATWQWFVNK
ncbi:MAG: GDP-mannose 4,6-dehydratase [Desulfarculales bacterium]|nr:GDP-mannose 4,6-dehydratase [Desulfarculales bacterium]